MIKMPQIRTKRLILRPWQESDLPLFAIMNSDPKIMEYIPSGLQSAEESNQYAQSIIEHFKKRGWGKWAVSEINGADFIGYIGLCYVDYEAPFTPAVEIGWRLAFDFWNKGYATEGALAALKYAFETINLQEVVAVTPQQNFRSIAVMKKIGMVHNEFDDFDHPKLPQDHELHRMVLYRLNRSKWLESNGTK